MIYLYGARIRTDIFNRYEKEKIINSKNIFKNNSGVVGREVPFRGSRSHTNLNKPQEQMQTGLKLIFSFPC